MDIERVNGVLVRAIDRVQTDEVEAMVEAMAKGVTSYTVPAPTKKGMLRKRRAPVRKASKGEPLGIEHFEKMLKKYEPLLPELERRIAAMKKRLEESRG